MFRHKVIYSMFVGLLVCFLQDTVPTSYKKIFIFINFQNLVVIHILSEHHNNLTSHTHRYRYGRAGIRRDTMGVLLVPLAPRWIGGQQVLGGWKGRVGAGRGCWGHWEEWMGVGGSRVNR